MKFRKIDEKTVCCMLSEEDLIDNSITIEDFIQNRDKVQDFLEELIETAKEEVGFETTGPMLSIQVMSMHPNGVMLTFSSDPKDMSGIIKAGIAHMKGELDDEDWIEHEDMVEPVVIEDAEEEKQNEKQPVILAFPDLQTIFEFLKHVSVQGAVIDSSLYKSKLSCTYYLLAEKTRISSERYQAFIATAMEYATIVGSSYYDMEAVKEYQTCLIEEKAVSVLRKIATATSGKKGA